MYVKESSQPEYSGWEFLCVSKLESGGQIATGNRLL